MMEKMRGDMLEMILNSPRGRITEKETKFLIHQVCRNSRIYSSLIELLQLSLSFSCFLFLVSFKHWSILFFICSFASFVYSFVCLSFAFLIIFFFAIIPYEVICF